MHLAQKAEYGVDLDSGEAEAGSLASRHLGDATTMQEMLGAAGLKVEELVEREAELHPIEAEPTASCVSQS